MIIRANEHHPAPQLQGRVQWLISEKLSVEQTAFRLKRAGDGVGIDHEDRVGVKDGFGAGDADTAGVDGELRLGIRMRMGLKMGLGMSVGLELKMRLGVRIGLGMCLNLGLGLNPSWKWEPWREQLCLLYGDRGALLGNSSVRAW